MGAVRMPSRLEDLSVAERIRLVQDLWDHIASHPDDVPLTPAQRDELDRRLDDHRANPDNVVDWEVAKQHDTDK